MASLSQSLGLSESPEREYRRGVQGEGESPLLHSLERSDRFDTGFELHIHGSCPRCHHLHRRVPFALPDDDTLHTRFHCERCKHPIFGLGRTSTQDSLASVDSIPIHNGVLDPVEVSRMCSDLRRPQRSLTLDTSSRTAPGHLLQEPLSAITERSSPAERSRSTSDARGGPVDAVDHEQSGSSEPLASPEGRSGARPAAGSPMVLWLHHHQGGSYTWKYIYGLMRRLAKRICGTSREFKLCGFGLRFQVTSKFLEEPRVSLQHNAPISSAPATSPSFNVQAAADGDRKSHPLTASAEEPGALSEGATIAVNDSLHIRRREKTLQRKALLERCTCTQDCHCRKEDDDLLSIGGNSHNTGIANAQRGSLRNGPTTGSQISDTSEPASRDHNSSPIRSDIRPYPYAHMGAIFLARRRMSSEGSSNSIRDNSQRRGRSGQSSTVHSSGSSLSLNPQRPIMPGRSLSASVLPSSRDAAEYTSMVADVLGHVHELQQARPSSLPWLQEDLDIPSGEPAPPGENDEETHTDGLLSNRVDPGSTLHSHDRLAELAHINGVRTPASQSTGNDGIPVDSDEPIAAIAYVDGVSDHTEAESITSAWERSTTRELMSDHTDPTSQHIDSD